MPPDPKRLAGGSAGRPLAPEPIARLSAMGATITTWSPLGAELLGDFARSPAGGLIKIYSEHQGSLRMVEDAFAVAVAAARSSIGAGDNAQSEGSYAKVGA